MNSSINIKKVVVSLKNSASVFITHAKFIFIIIILLLTGFLIFQINRLANTEPTDEQISAQLQTIKRPKIDEATINKIKKLEDRNVGVQALFKQARDNPFQD